VAFTLGADSKPVDQRSNTPLIGFLAPFEADFGR
jgi:hypothetical protein